MAVYWLWPTSEKLQMSEVVARFHYEAASGRFSMERGASFEDLKVLSAVTVASNRFAHSMIAVEAGSSLKFSEEQIKAFAAFAESVERSLILLCEALRGREVPRNEFPDVRSAYVQFAESQEKASEQYAIIYEETDRMTNSLVTLTEQVLRRLFNKRSQNKSIETAAT